MHSECRGAILVLLAALAESCGSSRTLADGGAPGSDAALDASRDAAADAGWDAAPQVGCEGWVTDGERACVPAGPFYFGWVVDESVCPDGSPKGLESVRHMAEEYGYGDLARIEHTDVFLIDLREVSIRQYADYVAATAVAPPPASCENPYYRYEECPESSTKTGWSEDGEPLAEWLDLPVTCITQEEAEVYCAFRGGNLPDTKQWMKAARGPFPNKREYPWSEDQPPPWCASRSLPYGAIAAVHEDAPGPDAWCDYVPQLGRPDRVDSHDEWASPYGLVNVIANAAEWVRVAATGDGYERAGIDVMSGPFTSESPLGIHATPNGWAFLQISYGMNAQLVLDPERTGEVLRERTIGFRCAYPY